MIETKQLRENIGKAIRHYRKEKKISQYKLAELTGLSPSYISEIETGKKIPSLETLFGIAESLGVDIWDLLLPIDLPPNIRIAVKSLLKTPEKESSLANV